jgi:hypothetical protein
MRVTSIRCGLIGLTSTLAVTAVLLGTVPAASAASTVPTTIKAKPDNVMVNTVTKLTGKGFLPKTSFTVEECSETTWTVPTDPCDTTNTITIHTNAKGSFHAKFTVQGCPVGASPGSAGLAMLCYIGVPQPSGIDTVALQPETSVVVTYP